MENKELQVLDSPDGQREDEIQNLTNKLRLLKECSEGRTKHISAALEQIPCTSKLIYSAIELLNTNAENIDDVKSMNYGVTALLQACDEYLKDMWARLGDVQIDFVREADMLNEDKSSTPKEKPEDDLPF